jgi:hypothetical protein
MAVRALSARATAAPAGSQRAHPIQTIACQALTACPNAWHAHGAVRGACWPHPRDAILRFSPVVHTAKPAHDAAWPRRPNGKALFDFHSNIVSGFHHLFTTDPSFYQMIWRHHSLDSARPHKHTPRSQFRRM